MRQSAMNSVRQLASLRLTVPGMFLYGLGVLVRYFDPAAPVAWTVLPLLLLALNLLAAIFTRPAFRRQPALLLFHICLLIVVLLAAGNETVTMQGRVELTEGQAFSAEAVEVLQQGPGHSLDGLARVAFVQGPVGVSYNPGLNRAHTESYLQVDRPGAAGGAQVIGDNTPLTIDGYRFYTTSNKGYSAIIVWEEAGGMRMTGAVNFPSYPLNDWNQQNSWQSPAGTRLDLELVLPDAPDPARQWTLQSRDATAVLGVITGGVTRTIRPGEQLDIDGGRLTFIDVRLWMGYEIRYEPLLPWLFGCAFLGVLALAWHFQRQLQAPVLVHYKEGEHDGFPVPRT